MRSQCVQRGFTLIELMMTLLIAAILMAIAVPSFRSISLNSARSNVLSDLSALISRGRSEAVTRNAPIAACISNNLVSCDAATNTWEAGWMLFVDDGVGAGGVRANGVRDGDEAAIVVHEALNNGLQVRALNFSSVRTVQFTNEGMLASAGTFVYCDQRAEESLQAINISRVGQVRFAVDSDGNGEVEGSDDANIASCN